MARAIETARFAKPEVVNVYALLGQSNSLIVHFHGPKGDELRPERLFPHDLCAVVAGRAMGGLSCCTVGPLDHFDKHAWGSVGTVIGLQHKQSIVAAEPNDCGSHEEDVGGFSIRVVEQEKDIRLCDLARSISARAEHNEWVVRDYEVLGLFLHPPCIVEEIAGQQRIITFRELASRFPNLPIYTFWDRAIYQVVPENRRVAHAEIYRC
jgi:hypothetical protein